MSLITNGVDVKTIIYNGVDLQQVNCDGQVVWRKGIARTDYAVASNSGTFGNRFAPSYELSNDVPIGADNITPAWSSWVSISKIQIVLSASRTRWGNNGLKSAFYINGTKIIDGSNYPGDENGGGTPSTTINFTVPAQYYNTSNWKLTLWQSLDYGDADSSGGYGWAENGNFSWSVNISGIQKA